MCKMGDLLNSLQYNHTEADSGTTDRMVIGITASRRAYAALYFAHLQGKHETQQQMLLPPILQQRDTLPLIVDPHPDRILQSK